MADEFQSPLCSNGSWWNTMRGVGCPVTVPAAASPFSCSSAVIDDMGCFFMDSSLPPTDFGLSSPTKDWSQPFFSGRAENSSHAVHHEELVPKPYFQQDPATAMGDSNHIQEMNQLLFSEQHPFTSDRESGKGAVSYPYLQGLLENEVLSLQHLPSSNFDPPQFFKPSSNQNGQLPLVHQFHFNNNNSNNNNSTTTYDEGKSTGHRLYSSGNNNTPSVSRSHEEKSSSNCSTATKKSNSEGSRSTSTVSKKNGNDQPATKRPRIEMPSPLPTFNVRKEKLQDRVTALQQLVSPFGKTDTASVLHEAVEYIKFLHDQVKVLSAPYMESGHPMHSQQKLIGSNDVKEQKRDLRSQGLCLIPISSTFAVADEPIADYWIPTFGGS